MAAETILAAREACLFAQVKLVSRLVTRSDESSPSAKIRICGHPGRPTSGPSEAWTTRLAAMPRDARSSGLFLFLFIIGEAILQPEVELAEYQRYHTHDCYECEHRSGRRNSVE